MPWPLTIMRSGTGPDGSQAVRAFQRRVLTNTLALRPNLSLASAIKESTLRRDGNGNPAIDRARSHGRIDVLSAAILAVGAGAKASAGSASTECGRMKLPKNWAALRHAALRRAGWRSQRSGKAGRLRSPPQVGGASHNRR